MNCKKIDIEKWKRKDIFQHFAKETVCSVSLTYDIDVTLLSQICNKNKLKFYTVTLYCISKAVNLREDFKYKYLWQTDELVLQETISPKHNVFHEDTETFTSVVTPYDENFSAFYNACNSDIELAKNTRNYILKDADNSFDASYIPWLSYKSINLELPDGYIYLTPIINWGRYREENGKLLMPVTIKIQHSVADGFHISRFMIDLQTICNNFNL